MTPHQHKSKSANKNYRGRKLIIDKEHYLKMESRESISMDHIHENQNAQTKLLRKKILLMKNGDWKREQILQTAPVTSNYRCGANADSDLMKTVYVMTLLTRLPFKYPVQRIGEEWITIPVSDNIRN